MLGAGADKVSLNTSAVADPELVSAASAKFGNQCIVVAIDAKRDGGGWKVYTHGGRNKTPLDAVEWAREMQRRGAGEILLTSMDCDGTKDGYDIALTKAVSDAVTIPGNRLGRGWQFAAPRGRREAWRGERGFGRVDFPFRDVQHTTGKERDEVCRSPRP